MPAIPDPVVVSPAQFTRGGFDPRQTVLVHIDQTQYDGLVRGLKPQLGAPDHLSGLWIVPVPGRPGYVAFPICWPDEVPVIDKQGNMRCVPTDFGDKIPPPGVAPLPDPCHLKLVVASNGRIRLTCEGRCARGRCRFRGIWNVRGGVLLGCTCQHFAAPPGVGGGTIPTGSASSSSTRKRASKRK